LRPVSPRRQIFEAKFEKFLSNKSQKEHIEGRAKALKPAPFDVVTKNQSSPSKNTNRYKSTKATSGKFDGEDLIPDGYEDHLMR